MIKLRVKCDGFLFLRKVVFFLFVFFKKQRRQNLTRTLMDSLSLSFYLCFCYGHAYGTLVFLCFKIMHFASLPVLPCHLLLISFTLKKKKKTYYSFPHYKSNKIKIKIPTSHHDVHRIPRHIRIQIKVYNQWYFIHDTLPFYKFSPSIYNIINISTFTVSILSNEEDAPFFSFLFLHLNSLSHMPFFFNRTLSCA